MTPVAKTRLLVLQGTPFCNLDCGYCYLPGRDRHRPMALATVALAARRLREDGLAGPSLTVVWHAGEPLVLPPAWYREAIDALAAELPGVAVCHAFQTNATLVDDAWCAFLRRPDVRVGVSVDGPAALHDRHRRGRDGRGSHAATMAGLARLRAAGVPFHAIAVVTADTLAAPDAFADFFEALGVPLGCSVDEAEGAHAASSLAGREAAHAAFVERLLARALASGGRLVVREFVQAAARIAEPLPRVRIGAVDAPFNEQALPFAIVSVAADGRWSTFSPELLGQRWPAHRDFVCGDVAAGGYRDALGREPLAGLWREVAAGVARCARACAHFGFCGGGAPANKLFEHGSADAGETLYCRGAVKRPFDALLRRCERELQEAAR